MNVAVGLAGGKISDKADFFHGAGGINELAQRGERVLRAIQRGHIHFRIMRRAGRQDYRKNVAHGAAIAIETRPQSGAGLIAANGAAVLIMPVVHGSTLPVVSRRDYTGDGINVLEPPYRRAKQVQLCLTDAGQRVGQGLAVIGIVRGRASCKPDAAGLHA